MAMAMIAAPAGPNTACNAPRRRDRRAHFESAIAAARKGRQGSRGKYRVMTMIVPKRHRERDVALGIFHFGGGEADVVPGIGGK